KELKMHITKAIQNGKLVEMFDEKGNKVFENEGELYEFKSPTVRVKTFEDTIDAIWAEGKEICERTEHLVNVEFEYKGVVIKGFGVFSKKDYNGATMTSPYNGIKTNDGYHIPGHAHWGNDERKIEHETIESLKRAYDEYLLLLRKKEDITKIVNAPFPLSRHLKKNREELISILDFVKKYEKKDRLSEYDYNTFIFRLEKEIENYAKMIENDYRVSFYEKFSIIKNFNEVAESIANYKEA
ncbi:MAG: hypothetical protein J6Z11_14990, partial [Candidatus Riflebacteria bacterium]|nr:hypothetical protein [Candidatus Riflebacteria bacterium]